MNQYKLVIIIFLISCQAFSQEKIEIVFNIKGTNSPKTWEKPKEADFVSKTITKTDKNYYNKETIQTLRADIKSKYGDFSIILFDYNKNGTFDDFRTLGSKIDGDGIEVTNYKSFQNNKFKTSRISIYKNHLVFINGVGFRIKNLRKDSNDYYKADLVKEDIQQQETEQETISIFYEIGKYKLSKENNSIINQFLKTLDSTATYRVKIVSSADYLGSKESNFTLAKNRAKEIEITLNKTFSKLFTSIEMVNKGEVSELEKEKKDKQIGNLKNRKTSILFIKNKIPKKEQIKQVINNEKKVYIYNPKKQEFDLKVGKKFILKRLIFHRGTAIMQQRSKSSLKGLVRFLKENPKVEIEIQGHLCCNAGRYQPDKTKIVPFHGEDLSSKRAKLVYRYLIKNRIRSKRLTYNGYGFQSPLHYPEKTEKDKSENKRVEIVITKI